jgi:hypothetical protein
MFTRRRHPCGGLGACRDRVRPKPLRDRRKPFST